MATDQFINALVYDLPYSNPVPIISPIERTKEDATMAIKHILSVNPAFDIEIVKSFFRLAPQYRIDPLMAIAQSILETGYFKFNSPGEIVTPDQHNYGAMGVTDTGVKGDIYPTIDDGVTAQLEHLWAYACTDPLPHRGEPTDKRFNYVNRGCAKYWEQLAGRWAYPGYDNNKYTPYYAMLNNDTYGQRILIRYNRIIKTQVTQQEIDYYFPNEEVIIPVAPDQEPEPEVEQVGFFVNNTPKTFQYTEEEWKTYENMILGYGDYAVYITQGDPKIKIGNGVDTVAKLNFSSNIYYQNSEPVTAPLGSTWVVKGE